MSLTIAPENLDATPRGAPSVMSWVDFALCKGKTNLFFGPPGERPSKRRRRETLARSYCLVCPVNEPCREAGRGGRENGLWGDENEEERAAMGYAPRATERRSVARAARDARNADRLRASA
jgi:WhiB family redox-sensing transcriptional regulator